MELPIRTRQRACFLLLGWVALNVGCRTNSYAEGGALLGGLTGAGVGAVVGDSLGDAGAGALVGAGVGAITGAAIGDSLDEIDARNRQQIAQQMGRTVRPGAATSDEVIAMNQAGVDPQLIVNHIRNNGVAAPPNVDEILRLSSAGVPTRVIEAMQSPPPQVRVASAPPPIIVEERHYFSPPVIFAPSRRYFHRRPRSGVSWGLSFSSD
jgi:hypothetical protein